MWIRLMNCIYSYGVLSHREFLRLLNVLSHHTISLIFSNLKSSKPMNVLTQKPNCLATSPEIDLVLSSLNPCSLWLVLFSHACVLFHQLDCMIFRAKTIF